MLLSNFQFIVYYNNLCVILSSTTVKSFKVLPVINHNRCVEKMSGFGRKITASNPEDILLKIWQYTGNCMIYLTFPKEHTTEKTDVCICVKITTLMYLNRLIKRSRYLAGCYSLIRRAKYYYYTENTIFAISVAILCKIKIGIEEVSVGEYITHY